MQRSTEYRGNLPSAMAIPFWGRLYILHEDTMNKPVGEFQAQIAQKFTPLEKVTYSCRWYRLFLRDGGLMPPSLAVRELCSLTGFSLKIGEFIQE